IDSHLYISGGNRVVGYDLDRPERTWSGFIFGSEEEGKIAGTMFASDAVVAVESPADWKSEEPMPWARLNIFSRAVTESGESGSLTYTPMVKPEGGLKQWQLVAGGLYYLSGNGELTYLRGRATEQASDGATEQAP